MKSLAHTPTSTDGGMYFTPAMATAKDQVTAAQIWDNINSFVNTRDKAYKKLLGQGVNVPEFAQKQNAIKMLRAQLEASKQWGLVAQARWINAMRPLIACLLPFDRHHEARLRTYRRRIIFLLNYCDKLLQDQHKLPFTINT